MKKSFLGTTFLALLAAASLAGCSSSSNEATAETAAETAEESTAEAKEADGDLEKLVVGASPDPGSCKRPSGRQGLRSGDRRVY